MLSPHTEALLIATELGNVMAAMHAIKMGTDVHYVIDVDHQDFRPPVKLAAEGGYEKMVHVLLNFGAFFWWTHH